MMEVDDPPPDLMEVDPAPNTSATPAAAGGAAARSSIVSTMSQRDILIGCAAELLAEVMAGDRELPGLQAAITAVAASDPWQASWSSNWPQQQQQQQGGQHAAAAGVEGGNGVTTGSHPVWLWSPLKCRLGDVGPELRQALLLAAGEALEANLCAMQQQQEEEEDEKEVVVASSTIKTAPNPDELVFKRVRQQQQQQAAGGSSSSFRQLPRLFWDAEVAELLLSSSEHLQLLGQVLCSCGIPPTPAAIDPNHDYDAPSEDGYDDSCGDGSSSSSSGPVCLPEQGSLMDAALGSLLKLLAIDLAQSGAAVAEARPNGSSGSSSSGKDRKTVGVLQKALAVTPGELQLLLQPEMNREDQKSLERGRQPNLWSTEQLQQAKLLQQVMLTWLQVPLAQHATVQQGTGAGQARFDQAAAAEFDRRFGQLAAWLGQPATGAQEGTTVAAAAAAAGGRDSTDAAAAHAVELGTPAAALVAMLLRQAPGLLTVAPGVTSALRALLRGTSAAAEQLQTKEAALLAAPRSEQDQRTKRARLRHQTRNYYDPDSDREPDDPHLKLLQKQLVRVLRHMGTAAAAYLGAESAAAAHPCSSSSSSGTSSSTADEGDGEEAEDASAAPVLTLSSAAAQVVLSRFEELLSLAPVEQLVTVWTGWGPTTLRVVLQLLASTLPAGAHKATAPDATSSSSSSQVAELRLGSTTGPKGKLTVIWSWLTSSGVLTSRSLFKHSSGVLPFPLQPAAAAAVRLAVSPPDSPGPQLQLSQHSLEVLQQLLLARAHPDTTDLMPATRTPYTYGDCDHQLMWAYQDINGYQNCSTQQLLAALLLGAGSEQAPSLIQGLLDQVGLAAAGGKPPAAGGTIRQAVSPAKAKAKARRVTETKLSFVSEVVFGVGFWRAHLQQMQKQVRQQQQRLVKRQQQKQGVPAVGAPAAAAAAVNAGAALGAVSVRTQQLLKALESLQSTGAWASILDAWVNAMYCQVQPPKESAAVLAAWLESLSAGSTASPPAASAPAAGATAGAAAGGAAAGAGSKGKGTRKAGKGQQQQQMQATPAAAARLQRLLPALEARSISADKWLQSKAQQQQDSESPSSHPDDATGDTGDEWVSHHTPALGDELGGLVEFVGACAALVEGGDKEENEREKDLEVTPAVEAGLQVSGGWLCGWMVVDEWLGGVGWGGVGASC
jgi:hypothetical protein